MYLNLRRNGDNLEAELAGTWRGVELPAIDAELAAHSFAGASTLRVIVPEAVTLDLAGAWRLRKWLKTAEDAGLEVAFEGEKPAQLELIESTFDGKLHLTPPSSSESTFEPVSALGRHVTHRVQSVRVALDFVGHIPMTWLRACPSWGRLRPASITRHVY